MIGALLGHSQPNTTARYAHLVASPLHQAVDAIGARIVEAMGVKRTDHIASGDHVFKFLVRYSRRSFRQDRPLFNLLRALLLPSKLRIWGSEVRILSGAPLKSRN